MTGPFVVFVLEVDEPKGVRDAQAFLDTLRMLRGVKYAGATDSSFTDDAKHAELVVSESEALL